jgi:predicted nucleotidyltransferase
MKTITDPVGYAKNAADAYASLYGTDLVAAILYGSAAGSSYDPKKSDINLLIILSSMSPELIAKSATLQAKYARKRFDRPLFLDAAYIARSCDSYPMEFLDIKQSYKVLFGADVLKDITPQQEHLRLQVERELKGKWLHLLHDYASACGNNRRLTNLVRQSFKAFLPVFRALQYLKGANIPAVKTDLLREIEATYSLQSHSLLDIADTVSGKQVAGLEQRCIAYAGAVKKIIDEIDKN